LTAVFVYSIGSAIDEFNRNARIREKLNPPKQAWSMERLVGLSSIGAISLFARRQLAHRPHYDRQRSAGFFSFI